MQDEQLHCIYVDIKRRGLKFRGCCKINLRPTKISWTLELTLTIDGDELKKCRVMRYDLERKILSVRSHIRCTALVGQLSFNEICWLLCSNPTNRQNDTQTVPIT